MHYGRRMDAVTTRPIPARPLALPNLLTYARIVAVPLVVACMYWQSILAGGMWLRWVALALFIAAGITDILDGYFARSLGQQSTTPRLANSGRWSCTGTVKWRTARPTQSHAH